MGEEEPTWAGEAMNRPERGDRPLRQMEEERPGERSRCSRDEAGEKGQRPATFPRGGASAAGSPWGWGRLPCM